MKINGIRMGVGSTILVTKHRIPKTPWWMFWRKENKKVNGVYKVEVMTEQERPAALDAYNRILSVLSEYKAITGQHYDLLNGDIDTVRAALSSPRVDAQPKYKRVDLGNMSCMGVFTSNLGSNFTRGYNQAIDDIKSKYGELYAEVKE